jgi:hypothetical protein
MEVGNDSAHRLLSASDAAALAELQHRLQVVRDRVRGVAHRQHSGFYLFGRPGTSKTFTVLSTLKETGVTYCKASGHLTPMGLFELLAEHNEEVIVLDDVAHLLTHSTSVQLLLAALENRTNVAGGRVVSYKRQGREVKVNFRGGIIFISNLELHSRPLLEALKSRVHYLRHDPTEEQVAALMRHIASQGWSTDHAQLSADECFEVTEFLIAESKRLKCRLDIRHLVEKALPDFIQHRQGHTVPLT